MAGMTMDMYSMCPSHLTEMRRCPSLKVGLLASQSCLLDTLSLHTHTPATTDDLLHHPSLAQLEREIDLRHTCGYITLLRTGAPRIRLGGGGEGRGGEGRGGEGR